MNVLISRRSTDGVALKITALSQGAGLPCVITALSVVLWAWSLRTVDVSEMSGVGLVSVLSPQTYFALALGVVGFMVALYQQRLVIPLLAFQLTMWIVMLHGFNSLVAVEPVFSVAWRHAGITDFILEAGGFDTSLDAYFSWPGFFALSALFTEVAGLADPTELIRWAPPFFNLLYMAPLAMMLKFAHPDPRVLWLGLWLFYTTNWISQDYFSPQAFGYFCYLLVLAILLRWFPNNQNPLPWLKLRMLSPGSRTLAPQEAWARSLDANSPDPVEGQYYRLGAAAVLIVVFAAVVPSHQLTPFALVLGVTLLAMSRRIALPGLPALMAVLLGCWISYMTVDYLSGHFHAAFNPITPGASASANLEGRMKGTSEHMVVVYSRLGMAALVWVLAVVGAIKSRGRLRNWSSFVILFGAPFGLLVLQPYGGEMLLRVYLLVLPFCVVFIAGFLGPGFAKSLTSVVRIGVASLFGVVLLSGFLVTRYGNQSLDMFTTAEVKAIEHLYRISPKGSLLLAADANLPWKYQDYGSYEYKSLDRDLGSSSEGALEDGVADLMRQAEGSQAFFIITRSQKEMVKQLGLVPPNNSVELETGDDRSWLDGLQAKLKDSPDFNLIFENADAAIFVLSDKP